MPKYDVFISFSMADRKTVEGICGYLERYGYRCFVSYRDIPPAVSWPSFISSAIKDSSLMVAVFSKDFNVSNETERELTIASKNNIPILTFKVSDTVMSDSKEYFLANLNWIDAFPNPENYFGKLKESIEKLIGKPERGYLIDEEIRKQQEVEKEQKAREEREQLRRELEIERNRRKEEENMRRLSEQKRVWLEHKLEADRQSSAKDNNQNKKRKTPLNPRKRLWMPIIAVLFAVVLVMVLTSRVSKPDLQPQIETITVNGVSFNMVYVEGGTFKMGATEEQGNDSYNDEKPSHYVTLSDYYIGETEVTQELWKAVMGNNPSYYSDDEKKPVDSVSWNNVQEFITKLSNQTNRKFRLPTEAEWEYAARGGNQSCNCKYSGDDSIDKIAWYYSNSKEETHPVAQLRPNELGLYDMSGNVWEWCQDWYSEDYYYSGENFNPNGPSKCNYHVLRGGSCVTDARRCRVSNRYYNMSQFRYRSYGFRLVMSL